MNRPENSASKMGILFVHAADGNRLGPHRMYVEFADEFNRLGFSTFRFDLSGHGDSFGDTSNGDTEKDLADLKNAISFFVKMAPVENVIFFGISRGAYLCFNSAAKFQLPLSGLILLSLPVSSGKTALKKVNHALTDYIKKAFYPYNIRRLLTCRINFLQVLKTIVKPILSGRRFRQIQSGKLISRCNAILIYGQCDPICENSSRYYSQLLDKNRIPNELHIIENANHSFFHYQWKQQILDLCTAWLKKAKNQ